MILFLLHVSQKVNPGTNMNVNCSTCLELLTPSDDLSSAPCGHIFHSCCILQWLETGKSSCPQCRSKCYEKQLRRVYFTEAANITLDTQSNVNTLQDRLDSLTFQLRCSENNLKTANEGKEKSIVQAIALREELREVERKLSSTKEQIVDIKAENRLLRGEKSKSDKAKKEAKELSERLKEYEHIQFIINESASKVNQKLHELCDFSKATKESTIIIGKKGI